jgi:hypothetical protein
MGWVASDLKIGEMGDVSALGERSIGAVIKRILSFDSVHQIGPFTPSNKKLMIVGERVVEGFENGKYFCL